MSAKYKAFCVWGGYYIDPLYFMEEGWQRENMWQRRLAKRNLRKCLSECKK